MLETVLNWIDQLPVWINALTAFVTAASVLTALTPTQTDDKIVASILRVLNVLALNFGKNRNADDTKN
ncbi:hypothetical protein LCM08_06090 [Salipiger pacificus]|nr:hypothetical protein [Alloyangia pacifica]